MDLSTDSAAKRVRVRVNFSGKRYVGVVTVPDGITRVSDVLNDGRHFLHLEEAQTMEGPPAGGLVLNKDAITFIQALEEPVPTIPALRRRGGFAVVEVIMRHLEMEIRGKIFVPEGATAAEVLNDERDFLSLSDVHVVGTRERFPFLAISKPQVVAVEILEPVPA
jgi:hypothetical protein